MGGTMQQTTANTSSSVTEPWKDAQPALRQSLRTGQMLQKQWGHLTPQERSAIGGQRQNANFAKSYMPAQQDLISQLYAGGGYGEGDQDVRDAMQANRGMLSKYFDPNYLDPMSNPYLQPAIEQARRGAYTDVSDKFASAGRNFSGALADAASRGMTGAALPMLLGQYNTNVGAQQAAGQQAMGAATAGQEALNKSQQSRLQAQMAAPQQIQNLNIPQNMMMAAEAQRRNIPLDVLARTAGIFTGMGSLGGTSTGATTGSQYSNPYMTGLGSMIGLMGAYGGGF